MIQKLMFMSLFRLDLLLDIIYLNNVKHEKTEKKKKKKTDEELMNMPWHQT